MQIKKFYEEIGSDFSDVSRRLGGEQTVCYFVRKFASDKSFDDLKTAMSSFNHVDAFRAAHTLKGVSLNLGFDKLYEASKVLTDALRNKQTEGIGKLYEKVKNEYERILKAIDACS